MLKKWRGRKTSSPRKRGIAARRANSREDALGRKGEHAGTYFRTSRYFAVGHQWYASTREGDDVGPFSDRNQAELGLAWHLSDQPVDTPGAFEDPVPTPQRTATDFEVLLHEFSACRRERRQRSINGVCAWAQQRLDEFEQDSDPRYSQGRGRAAIKARAVRHFLAELEH